MNILIWILTTIHVIIAAVLVVLVLMQKSSDQGVGAAFGGQMTETVFGGSITPLVRMTIYCACILLATTLTLAVLHSRRSGQTQAPSLLNKLQQTAPAVPGGAAPAIPGTTTEQAPAPAPVN
ncbi:MAG: preprotein translocase subunit SecG [Verrucomicrobia bacterium]|nr:preprotein translocase subunit SecG [Verrucomicrobiota bacterium]